MQEKTETLTEPEEAITMGNPIQNHRHNIINTLREARNEAPTEQITTLYYTVKPMLKGRQGMQKDEQVATLTAVRDMLVAFDVDESEFAQFAESKKASWQEQRDYLQSQVDYMLEQIAALDAQIAAESPTAGLVLAVETLLEKARDEALGAVSLAQERDFDAYIAEKKAAQDSYSDDEDEDDDDEDGM